MPSSARVLMTLLSALAMDLFPLKARRAIVSYTTAWCVTAARVRGTSEAHSLFPPRQTVTNVLYCLKARLHASTMGQGHSLKLKSRGLCCSSRNVRSLAIHSPPMSVCDGRDITDQCDA